MKKMLYGFIALFLLGITGCGTSGENELAGSLTFSGELVTDTTGYYYATSTAQYTHPSKDATGVELNFSINAYTTSGKPVYSASQKEKQPAGGWTITWPVIVQQKEAIIVDLSVSTGDLSGFERLTIPAVGQFGATPLFVNMSTVRPQTVTLSGSVAPYYVVGGLPYGVTAGIVGTTLTIDEPSFQKLDGSITIQSTSLEELIITLRY